MLVWINGAYGAGKTSVARALSPRLGNAPIVDPEEIGFMLRRVLPQPKTGDFQDMPLWRTLTIEVLAAADQVAEGPVIVPMTVARLDYLNEIVGGLRARGIKVRHFTLLASPRTLRFRLLKRLDRPAATRWCLAQVPRCVTELAAPDYADHIQTDRRSVWDVTDEILSRLG